VYRTVTQPVIEPIVQMPAAATPEPLSDATFVTQIEYQAGISTLGNSLRQLIEANTFNSASPPLGGGGSNTIAAANAINSLSNVTITNPTISGGNVTATSFSGLLETKNGGTGTAPSYGQLLVGNSSGGYTITATSSLGISGGGRAANPAGSDTHVQFNNGGAFGGSSSFTFSTSTDVLSVDNASTTNATSTNLTASNASTPNFTVSTGFTFGSATGVLKAVAGVVSSTFVNLATANGGTGTSTAPSYGQVLVGNASGGYNLVATSRSALQRRSHSMG
jgi:hypothetical protein